MKLLDLAIPGWLKLATGGLVLVCMLWLGLVLKGWHEDSLALPGVKQELTASRAETKQVRLDLIAESGRLATVNEGLARENETLRSQRAAIPVRSVRLCTPSQAGEGDPPAAGGGDAATAGAGPLSPEAGRDPVAGPEIGPDLYALMDEADEAVRRARGAQAYIAGLPGACQ